MGGVGIAIHIKRRPDAHQRLDSDFFSELRQSSSRCIEPLITHYLNDIPAWEKPDLSEYCQVDMAQLKPLLRELCQSPIRRNCTSGLDLSRAIDVVILRFGQTRPIRKANFFGRFRSRGPRQRDRDIQNPLEPESVRLRWVANRERASRRAVYCIRLPGLKEGCLISAVH